MKKIKGFSITLLFILIVLSLSKCDDVQVSNEGNESSETSQESINISESRAMQPIVAAGAEKYMEESKGDIIVITGGSRTGLNKVYEGTVNIGNSDVFADAIDGIPEDELVDHQVTALV